MTSNGAPIEFEVHLPQVTLRSLLNRVTVLLDLDNFGVLDENLSSDLRECAFNRNSDPLEIIRSPLS